VENRLSFLVIIFAFFLKNGSENEPLGADQSAFFRPLVAICASGLWPYLIFKQFMAGASSRQTGCRAPQVRRTLRTCGRAGHRGAGVPADLWHPQFKHIANAVPPCEQNPKISRPCGNPLPGRNLWPKEFFRERPAARTDPFQRPRPTVILCAREPLLTYSPAAAGNCGGVIGRAGSAIAKKPQEPASAQPGLLWPQDCVERTPGHG